MKTRSRNTLNDSVHRERRAWSRQAIIFETMEMLYIYFVPFLTKIRNSANIVQRDISNGIIININNYHSIIFTCHRKTGNKEAFVTSSGSIEITNKHSTKRTSAHCCSWTQIQNKPRFVSPVDKFSITVLLFVINFCIWKYPT